MLEGHHCIRLAHGDGDCVAVEAVCQQDGLFGGILTPTGLMTIVALTSPTDVVCRYLRQFGRVRRLFDEDDYFHVAFLPVLWLGLPASGTLMIERRDHAGEIRLRRTYQSYQCAFDKANAWGMRRHAHYSIMWANGFGSVDNQLHGTDVLRLTIVLQWDAWRNRKSENAIVLAHRRSNASSNLGAF